MQYLAICQKCRLAFALSTAMSAATCPKIDCGGTAVVSDGSYGSTFRLLHDAFPMAMPRSQRRDIQKLLRRLVSGKITPEQALQDEAISPEALTLLQLLLSLGFGAVNAILWLLVFLQTESHQQENRRDAAQSNEDQRRILQALNENLEHLHHNEELLAERLSRVAEAQLIELREERPPVQRRRRVESETEPKPQPPGPKPTPKKRKGKRS